MAEKKKIFGRSADGKFPEPPKDANGNPIKPPRRKKSE